MAPREGRDVGIDVSAVLRVRAHEHVDVVADGRAERRREAEVAVASAVQVVERQHGCRRRRYGDSLFDRGRRKCSVDGAT